MMLLYIFRKLYKYKFLIIFIIIIWIYSFISYFFVKNKNLDFFATIIFLIIFTFYISRHISRKSGWRLLTKEYGEKNSPIILPKRLIPIYGNIGGVNYPINMLFLEKGLLLKVHLLIRYSHKNLMLPWSVISKIIVRSALNKERNLSFWQKINLSSSDDKFAEIKLKEFPNIFIELPWSEEFKNSVPQNVKVDVRD